MYHKYWSTLLAIICRLSSHNSTHFFIGTRYFLLFDDLHSRHFSHSHHAFAAAARKNAPVFFNFPLKSIDRDTRFFPRQLLATCSQEFPTKLAAAGGRQTHFICCRRHRFMLFLALFGPKREIFNKSKVILTFYDWTGAGKNIGKIKIDQTAINACTHLVVESVYVHFSAITNHPRRNIKATFTPSTRLPANVISCSYEEVDADADDSSDDMTLKLWMEKLAGLATFPLSKPWLVPRHSFRKFD